MKLALANIIVIMIQLIIILSFPVLHHFRKKHIMLKSAFFAPLNLALMFSIYEIYGAQISFIEVSLFIFEHILCFYYDKKV